MKKKHTLVLRIPEQQYKALAEEAARLSSALDYKVPIAAVAVKMLLNGMRERGLWEEGLV